MSEFYNNAIFWIEVDRIKPNPYQPRKEFDEHHLRDLADSIRQYGVLQPLVVTRNETPQEDGSIHVEYELIAGERRLRASKLAGITQVPALIRQGEQDARIKLELAIIENLQREDLNPVDRALAFARLANEFNFKHTEIAKKVGKSREYVSNTLRLLALPQDILDALSKGKISEGHTRPLLMLNDKPAEQTTLFKEIVWKKLTVREAEQIARHIAKDKVRKKDDMSMDPELLTIERQLTESLGTRVQIERRSVGGGKLVIDFFTNDDLRTILDMVNTRGDLDALRTMREAMAARMAKPLDQSPARQIDASAAPVSTPSPTSAVPAVPMKPVAVPPVVTETPVDDTPVFPVVLKPSLDVPAMPVAPVVAAVTATHIAVEDLSPVEDVPVVTELPTIQPIVPVTPSIPPAQISSWQSAYPVASMPSTEPVESVIPSFAEEAHIFPEPVILESSFSDTPRSGAEDLHEEVLAVDTVSAHTVHIPVADESADPVTIAVHEEVYAAAEEPRTEEAVAAEASTVVADAIAQVIPDSLLHDREVEFDTPVDDRAGDEVVHSSSFAPAFAASTMDSGDDEDLYSVRNFSI